jgi:hypothetical protein
MAAAAVGGRVATFCWVLGQNIGQPDSGQATDPMGPDRPDGLGWGRGRGDRPPRRVTNIAQDRHQLSSRWALRSLRRPTYLERVIDDPGEPLRVTQILALG